MADLSLQLQADILPRESVEQLLVGGHWAPVLRRLTTGENLLLEGCRGVGKTMLMRAATVRLAADAKVGGKALGVHATFKRYLAAIPPPDAGATPELGHFKAWVNARILGALKDQLAQVYGEEHCARVASLWETDWQKVIARLETTYQGAGDLTFDDAGLSKDAFHELQGYTFTAGILQQVRAAFRLDLLVVLLDDAAHALDTRAQGAFFTLIKSLYSEGVAFKISVYPAVTRYGLDFSYGHDAVVVSLEDVPSQGVMDSFFALLRKRTELVADEDDADAKSLITELLERHQDWVRLLVYCANANPRGLLKLVSQLLTQLGNRAPAAMRYEDVRNAINYVMDRHLDNMVPGIIKDLDPRLLRASQILLEAFRDKIRTEPGPMQGAEPRMFLAISNSTQIKYLCTAATRLLVATNALTAQGPVRLGTRSRESGTVYLLHPGFVFRDNVLGTVTVERWLQHFSEMSPRVHAEISKTAPLWDEVFEEAGQEPSARCINGHPMMDPAAMCAECGARATPRGAAQMILEKDVGVLDLSDAMKQRLRDHGFMTVRQVFEATPDELDEIPYVGKARVGTIRFAVEVAVDEFFAG